MKPKIHPDLDKLIKDLEIEFDAIYDEATSIDIKNTLFEILLAIAFNCNDKAEEKYIYIYKQLINNTYRLIIQRVKVGLTFDEAPTTYGRYINYLKEDADKFINVNDPLDKESNHLIIGENYYALQNLLAAGYQNKIDIIYIDPPYNTQIIQTYKDKYKRDAWLSSIKERLELAKELLSDDGVIFVSIDDKEQAYLKVMMDEIFGEDNFVTNFIWKHKTNTQDSTYISNITEYIIMYKKKNLNIKNEKNNNSDSYKLEDEYVAKRGKYKLSKLDNASHTWSKKLDYKFEYNGYTYYPGGNERNWLDRKTKRSEKDWRWMWSRKKLEEGIRNNQIIFKNNQIYSKRYWCVDNNLKPIIRKNKSVNLIEGILNLNGTQELKDIFKNKIFDHPKPTKLIKWLIDRIDNKNAIILDFYAGSATTCHAVMQLNQEDGGERKCILCTNADNDIDKICYERLHRIMTGKGTKNETDFSWKDENDIFFNEKLKYWNIKKADVSLAKQYNQIINEKNKITKFKNLIKKVYKNLNPSFDEDNFEQEWINICLNLTLNSDIENKEVK